ncbi:hypothetical protein [Paenibacillus ferrarius]|uniref:hypothetical protein n=1 Tax=Paenibacillus ferrarius TaxID=1469647 RepID=UPI001301B7C0|nr:hypothetical protein [Paenibacillus ferrarius]
MDMFDVSNKEVVYNNRTYIIIEILYSGYAIAIEKDSEFPTQPVIIPNVLAV